MLPRWEHVIVAIDYERRACFIKFVGAHAEYDKVDAETVNRYQAMMDITPIRNDAACRSALAEIDRLWGSAAGTADGDRLDVLMTLVDAYERARWPDEDIDPVDAVKARMENAGRTRKEFEAIIGSSGRASEILNRRRHLTLAMIWRLVSEWQIPAELLIQPYKLSRPKRRRTHKRLPAYRQRAAARVPSAASKRRGR